MNEKWFLYRSILKNNWSSNLLKGKYYMQIMPSNRHALNYFAFLDALRRLLWKYSLWFLRIDCKRRLKLKRIFFLIVLPETQKSNVSHPPTTYFIDTVVGSILFASDEQLRAMIFRHWKTRKKFSFRFVFFIWREINRTETSSFELVLSSA